MNRVQFHPRYVVATFLLCISMAALTSRIDHWTRTTPGGNWVTGGVWAFYVLMLLWLVSRAITRKEDS